MRTADCRWVLLLPLLLALISVVAPLPGRASPSSPADTGGEAAVLLPDADPQRHAELFAIAEQALARQDFPTAMTWLTVLGEQGHVAAQLTLGQRYLTGSGVTTDTTEAVHWFQRAAIGRDASAQNRLGEFFRDGIGVEVDEVEASWWFLRAAEQGNATGQRNLGLLLLAGRGESADPATGAQWLQQAALQGDRVAQYQLGRRLLDGDGVAPDEPTGRHWLLKAAANEQPEASGLPDGESLADQKLMPAPLENLP